MTVCIAALADKGKSVVLATDKMLTIPGLSYQIEKSCYIKNYQVGDCHMLISGNAVAAYEVVTLAKEKLEIAKKDPNFCNIHIKEIIRQSYQEFRRKNVIQKFIEPRGLDLATYYSGRVVLPPQVIMEIENNLQNFNIDLEMIVVCKNPQNFYSIFLLSHPGELKCIDPIGYICIGSGAIHSVYYLTGANYSTEKTKKEVLGIVKAAKKQAEKSPGVGKETAFIELSAIDPEKKEEVTHA